jgi:hypothetical protein
MLVQSSRPSKLEVQTTPPSKIHTERKRKTKSPNKHTTFTPADLADIISELMTENIAIKQKDSSLFLFIGNNRVYEILEPQTNRYPRRALKQIRP